ncbi:limonene-1,2-epoxide hydrolase [Burkholderiales bacterium]|nr:limonene-1,2-epoxide hydrolase [Burkholderiales bacterium]
MDASAADAWVGDLLAAVDAKDADRFVGFLTEDAAFSYANAPAAVGREAVHAAVTAFFAAVRSLAHTPRRVWPVPGHVVVEGTVRYERLDGRVVTLPFVNVLSLEGERIDDYRVYIDGSPLFAP